MIVIVPTKTPANLIPCASAIWEVEPPRLPIVVVDDGLVPTATVQDRLVFARWDRENYPLWISGDKPFVFARNVNKGIAKAGNHDVVVCNDDALLRTPGGFTAMQRAAQEHPEYGVISATTNLAGNPDQQPRGVGLRDAGAKCVAFVCVLIPRRTIAAVGLLDERFTAYGWEDNDYCRRVREAGLKVGIFDGCYVDHASLKSTFRGDPHAAGDIGEGARIYQAKWGNLA